MLTEKESTTAVGTREGEGAVRAGWQPMRRIRCPESFSGDAVKFLGERVARR